MAIKPNKTPLTVGYAITELDALTLKNPITKGDWGLAQIFTHCAQSVEYSLQGFPEHKSAAFKSTAGKAAFSLFTAKGRMTHGLNEAIPGAPGISGEGNVAIALARLKKSLIDFDHYNGELAPHFAYGELTKAQYEMAHVMHLNDHLAEVITS